MSLPAKYGEIIHQPEYLIKRLRDIITSPSVNCIPPVHLNVISDTIQHLQRRVIEDKLEEDIKKMVDIEFKTIRI